MKKRLRHPNPVWRATRLVAGILMLLIGAIGGLLPIFQGWIFVLAGLMLLAPESRFIRKRIVRMRTLLNLRRRRRKRRDAPGPRARPSPRGSAKSRDAGAGQIDDSTKGDPMSLFSQGTGLGERIRRTAAARRTLARHAGLLVAAVALLAPPQVVPGADERVLLRYRFQPETAYEQTMSMSMSMKIDSEGFPEEMKPAMQAMFSDMKQELRLTTLIVTGPGEEDGSVPVEFRVGEIDAAITMAGEVMPLPGLDMSAQAEPIRGTFGPDGRSLDLAPFAIQGLPPDVMDRLVQAMPVLPEREMAPGESFEMPIEVSMPLPALAGGATMDLRGKSVFVLRSIEGRKAGFDVTQKMSLDQDAQESGTIAMEMSAEGRGSATFDLDEGFFSAMHIDFEMTMKMDLMGPAGMGTGSSGGGAAAPGGAFALRLQASGPVETTTVRRGPAGD